MGACSRLLGAGLLVGVGLLVGLVEGAVRPGLGRVVRRVVLALGLVVPLGLVAAVTKATGPLPLGVELRQRGGAGVSEISENRVPAGLGEAAKNFDAEIFFCNGQKKPMSVDCIAQLCVFHARL